MKTITRIQQNIGGFNIDDIVNATLEKERLAEEKRRRALRQKEDKRSKKDTRDEDEGLQKKERTIPETENESTENPMYILLDIGEYYEVRVHNIKSGRTKKYRYSKSLISTENEYKIQAVSYRTYMNWTAQVQETVKKNLVSEKYVPASSRDIHLLAKVAHHYHRTTGRFSSLGKQTGLFLADTIRDYGLGAYTRIQWEAQPKIIHSEFLPWQTQRNIPKKIKEKAERQLPLSLNDKNNDSLIKALFDDTPTNVLDIYRWIGELWYPKSIISTHIGTDSELPLSLNTVLTYNCTEKPTPSTSIEFILELAKKQLDDPFCCIGVQYQEYKTRGAP